MTEPLMPAGRELDVEMAMLLGASWSEPANGVSILGFGGDSETLATRVYDRAIVAYASLLRYSKKMDAAMVVVDWMHAKIHDAASDPIALDPWPHWNTLSLRYLGDGQISGWAATFCTTDGDDWSEPPGEYGVVVADLPAHAICLAARVALSGASLVAQRETDNGN